MAKQYLQQVYNLGDQAEVDAYYSAWAETYDQELIDQGYRTPDRCAAALASFVPGDAAILDVGCGTGLSGAALTAAGFTNISGQDVNPDMLAIARETGLYRELELTDLADQFPFAAGTYAALTAIGVIGIGAAPAALLTMSLEALAAGGHLVFSYNDHALAMPEYTQVLDQALTSGVAEQVFSEHGPHFEGLASSSTVYVLRRL